MIKIQVQGEARSLLQDIVQLQPGGELHLGLTGVNLEAATIDDIFSREVLFRDYLMEGFIKFTLKASELPQGLELTVKGSGNSRDKHLRSHFKFILSQAGHNATIV